MLFNTLYVRRNKASPHENGRKRVANACIHCRKGHARCGITRPCSRCISLGLECIEAPKTKTEKKAKKSPLSTYKKKAFLLSTLAYKLISTSRNLPEIRHHVDENWKLNISIMNKTTPIYSGVIVSANNPLIEYWSISIQNILGYDEESAKKVKFWWNIFAQEQVHDYMDRFRRELKTRKALSKTPQGKQALQQMRIVSDYGRGLLIDVNGGVMEVVVAINKIYKNDNPAELEAFIANLYW